MPEMRGIALRSVLPVREQGDNEADSVSCEHLRLFFGSFINNPLRFTFAAPNCLWLNQGNLT